MVRPKHIEVDGFARDPAIQKCPSCERTVAAEMQRNSNAVSQVLCIDCDEMMEVVERDGE